MERALQFRGALFLFGEIGKRDLLILCKYFQKKLYNYFLHSRILSIFTT